MNQSAVLPRVSWRQLILSLLVTTILIPVAFWDVSPTQIWTIMQRADWRPALLATILYVLTSFAKAARWEVFFQPKRLRFVSLFAALIVGQTLNFLLPARLGDVARIYTLRRREGEAGVRALITIGAEKLVELGVLLLLTFGVAWFLPLPQWILDPSLRLSAFMLAAVVCLSFLFVQRARLRQLWSLLLVRLWPLPPERLGRQFDLALDGYTPLWRTARLGKIFLWTVVVWWLMAATNYVLFYAFPMQASWLTAVVLLIVLQVGVAVPSTPGRIGVFQFLANQTLALFAVEREIAIAYGLLLYLVTFVPQVLLAAPFIWQELSRLRRMPARALDPVSHSS